MLTPIWHKIQDIKNIKMKKIIFNTLILASILTLVSCTKERLLELPVDGFSSVNVVNVAPGAGRAASPTVATMSLRLFVDTTSYSAVLGGFRYNTPSGYLSAIEGTRKVEFRDTLGTSARVLASINSHNFVQGMSQTFFVYDTLSAANSTSTLKVLRLNDNLNLPAVNSANVRFLHLAPLASNVDVTFLRTSVTPNDSVTITNRSYVGNTSTPDEAALSNFTTIPAGTYSIRLKAAGTQNVVSTTAATITSTGIFTYWATGTARSMPLTVGSFRNF